VLKKWLAHLMGWCSVKKKSKCSVVAAEQLRWRSGFLLYAARDRTVSGFGRNDGSLVKGKKDK